MTYPICPKCAHAPLPADQAFPAACPACGLILAKYAAPMLRPVRAAPPAGETAPAAGMAPEGEAAVGQGRTGWRHALAAWLLHVPEQVSRIDWTARLAGLALFGAWTLWIWRDLDIPAGESGSNFLHSVLIPFHEAGHYALFRWFGEFMFILGGTLGQHLLPIVVGGVLLVRKRNPYGAALAFWLLGYSMVDMGVYMYDAFDPKLGLIGGGTGAESDGHDWQNLFGDMGLLRSARGIGLCFGWVGCAMMTAGLAWAAAVVWRQKAALSDSPFAETGTP